MIAAAIKAGATTYAVTTECVRGKIESDATNNKIAAILFQAASYLTDPICKAQEFFRRIDVVDSLHPTAYKITNYMRKGFLLLGVVGAVFLGSIMSIPGIGLRAFGKYLQKRPFIYHKEEGNEKALPADRTLSLLSWNICCPAGEYSITDGGVTPWDFRINSVINKIIETDADVNCLYETFDTRSAFYLCDQLKQKGYGHFYFNIGPEIIGVSSGIFVASKYAIENPEFTPFPLDSLVGRTKNAAKGVFAFDVLSQGKAIARIHATHLQHSEQPQYPTSEEWSGRRKQMEIVVDKVDKVKDRCVIVTGDLNLDDEEYSVSPWRERFEKGDTYRDPDRTWGGDEFCAKLMNKPISQSLNLDHTMVVKGTAQQIRTSLINPQYHPSYFSKMALSDHAGLFSTITV